MNLLEHTVVGILSAPYYVSQDGPYGVRSWWSLDVNAHCYGRESLTTLTFPSEILALEVKVGYGFDA